jgi:hypothetical protein
MGLSKEQFIEATGGFRLGESKPGFLARARKIETLRKKLLSGVPPQQREELLEEMRRLQGRPPVEWDYDPND